MHFIYPKLEKNNTINELYSKCKKYKKHLSQSLENTQVSKCANVLLVQKLE